MVPSFLLEFWIEWGISVVVAVTRLILQTYLVGLRGWALDDYFVVLSIIAYSIHVGSIQAVHELGANIGLHPAFVATLSQQEIKNIRLGSIINLLGWYSWPALLWCCKASLLVLYSRVTNGLQQQRLVRMMGWFLGVTFIGTIFSNTFKCRPFSKNIQVVPPPGICTAGLPNLYFVGITNIVGDIFIFIILLPVVLKVQLPMIKKIFVGMVLFSAIFITVVSTLHTVYSILAVHGIGPKELGFRFGWATREDMTAMLIVNLPSIYFSVKKIRRRVPQSRVVISGQEESSGSSSRRTARSRKSTGDIGVATELRLDEMKRSQREKTGAAVLQDGLRRKSSHVVDCDGKNEHGVSVGPYGSAASLV